MTIYKIYWTDASGMPQAQDESTLSGALALVESKRHQGMAFVTMASHDPNQVGKPGVASVENGTTPDGIVYDWSKADRAGKVRRRERNQYGKTTNSSEKEEKSSGSF